MKTLIFALLMITSVFSGISIQPKMNHNFVFTNLNQELSPDSLQNRNNKIPASPGQQSPIKDSIPVMKIDTGDYKMPKKKVVTPEIMPQKEYPDSVGGSRN